MRKTARRIRNYKGPIDYIWFNVWSNVCYDTKMFLNQCILYAAAGLYLTFALGMCKSFYIL